MATVHRLGPRLWSRGTARPVRPEAQALLDVPAAYGGWGAWIDRRSWPQLRRLLERCRDDLALYRGTTSGEGTARPLATVQPVDAGRRRCFQAGLFDADGELCTVVEVTRREPLSEQAAPYDASPQRAGRRAVSQRGAFTAQPSPSSRVDDGEWWLGLILVRPDLRGRGIGASVVEALEEWVRAEGGRAIFVAVQRRNAAALHFARRMGFVPHAGTAGIVGQVELFMRCVA